MPMLVKLFGREKENLLFFLVVHYNKENIFGSPRACDGYFSLFSDL